jgi:hypothetical protein
MKLDWQTTRTMFAITHKPKTNKLLYSIVGNLGRDIFHKCYESTTDVSMTEAMQCMMEDAQDLLPGKTLEDTIELAEINAEMWLKLKHLKVVTND